MALALKKKKKKKKKKKNKSYYRVEERILIYRI